MTRRGSGGPALPASPARESRGAAGRPALGQFLRFAAVGASGVLVNLAVFAAIRALWRAAQAGAPLAGDFLANGGGFAVSVLSNYALNRSWTFRSSGPVTGELARFAAVSLSAYGANLLVFALCRRGLGLPALGSQLVAIAAVTPVNYLVNRGWSFRPRGRGSGSV